MQGDTAAAAAAAPVNGERKGSVPASLSLTLYLRQEMEMMLHDVCGFSLSASVERLKDERRPTGTPEIRRREDGMTCEMWNRETSQPVSRLNRMNEGRKRVHLKVWKGVEVSQGREGEE